MLSLLPILLERKENSDPRYLSNINFIPVEVGVTEFEMLTSAAME